MGRPGTGLGLAPRLVARRPRGCGLAGSRRRELDRALPGREARPQAGRIAWPRRFHDIDTRPAHQPGWQSGQPDALQYDIRRGQGLRGMRFAAPLDEQRHAAASWAAAVGAQGDPPAQHPMQRHPLGRSRHAGVVSGRPPVGSLALDRRCAGHPVDEAGSGRETPLQGRRIEIEPAWPTRRRRLGIDGDDLQIASRVAVRADGKQAVVRAHQRMASTRLGLDAECRFAPVGALGKAARGDDQMIELDRHGTTPTARPRPARRRRCSRPPRACCRRARGGRARAGRAAALAPRCSCAERGRHQ